MRQPPVPLMKMFELAMMDGFDEVAVTVSRPGSVWPSATVNRNSPGHGIPDDVWSVTLPMVGAVFTGGAVTVTVKFVEAVALPSLIVTVMVAVPV